MWGFPISIATGDATGYPSSSRPKRALEGPASRGPRPEPLRPLHAGRSAEAPRPPPLARPVPRGGGQGSGPGRASNRTQLPRAAPSALATSRRVQDLLSRMPRPAPHARSPASGHRAQPGAASNDTKRPRGAFPPFRGFASGGVCETYDHAPGAYIERGVGQGGDLAVLAGESPLAPEPSSPCPDRIAVLHPPGGRAAQVSVLGPAERGAMK